MSSPSRRTGAEWETRLEAHLRPRFGFCERLPLKGSNDQGDLYVIHGGHYYVIEAKAERTINLSGYLAEAAVEAAAFAKARGLPLEIVHPLAIVKRRNHPTGKAYVVQELDEWIREIKA